MADRIAVPRQRVRHYASAWRLAAVPLCAVAALPVVGNAAPVTHTVIIEAMRFDPAAITVKRGDIVVWINKDPFPHSVVAADRIDSASIAAGRRWTYVARAAGQFSYYCSFHPTMTGSLRVE